MRKDKESSRAEKLHYSRLKPVDGDTLHAMIRGECRTIRILGIDTEEMKDGNRKAAKRAAVALQVLEKMTGKIMKPRLYADKCKTREGWPYWQKDAYGRILATVYVWSWYRYVNYADYIIGKNLHKRHSKWNKSK